MSHQIEIEFISDNAEQFKLIDDKFGGWPLGQKFLVLIHECGPKRCYFSPNAIIDDGWNTMVHSADQYYWWKLGAVKKEYEIEKAIREYLTRATPAHRSINRIFKN